MNDFLEKTLQEEINKEIVEELRKHDEKNAMLDRDT